MRSEQPPQTGFISSEPEAPEPYLEAWKSVLELGEGLDDARLIAEFGNLSGQTSDRIPVNQSSRVEAYADVRVKGHDKSTRIRVESPTLEHIHERFCQSLAMEPASPLAVEIVHLRIRRYRKK